jgi:hypothetical protein
MRGRQSRRGLRHVIEPPSRPRGGKRRVFSQKMPHTLMTPSDFFSPSLLEQVGALLCIRAGIARPQDTRLALLTSAPTNPAITWSTIVQTATTLKHWCCLARLNRKEFMHPKPLAHTQEAYKHAPFLRMLQDFQQLSSDILNTVAALNIEL